MKSDAIVGALKAAAKADVDVDEALDQLSDLVELAHSKPVVNPDVILSVVPVGPDTDTTCVVGWDTCSACHLMVSKCSCKKGPTEPEYVKKFRQEKPNFRVPTPVSKGVKGSHASRSSEVVDPDNVLSRPDLAGPHDPQADADMDAIASAIPDGPPIQVGPLCNTCHRSIHPSAADQNDDSSWTCHLCQEASV